MGSGIKRSANRPKSGKNLKTHSEKKFRNESPESKAKYATKINSRRLRKMKQK
jgi:hypothetical protein